MYAKDAETHLVAHKLSLIKNPANYLAGFF